MAKKDGNGFWLDATGLPVPQKHVKPEDKERDKIVESLTKKAIELSDKLKAFKQACFNDVEDFISKLEDDYGISARTKEGNKTLRSFSGDMKIEVSTAKFIDFDEKLILAKELIDGCIEKWSRDSRSEIVVLVRDAFKVDKKGKIDRDRVIGLRKLKIKDADWVKAMDIIADSQTVVGKRQYVQFWTQAEDGTWTSIPLDIARL
ncbi:MAG: DUF3164 family protein [Deferribacterales bacterium]